VVEAELAELTLSQLSISSSLDHPVREICVSILASNALSPRQERRKWDTMENSIEGAVFVQTNAARTTR
jgi:hypothetical protein